MPKTGQKKFTVSWFGRGRDGTFASGRQEAADTIAWYLQSMVIGGGALGMAEITNAVLTMGRGPLLIVQTLKFLNEHIRFFR